MNDDSFTHTLRKKRLSLSFHNIDLLIKKLDIFQQKYSIVNTLKSNFKRCIYDVIDNSDNNRKVMKFIVTSSITDEQMKIYKFFSSYSHKNFCKINKIFENSIFTVLVMDYIYGSTLCDYTKHNEYDKIFIELIHALKYLHSNKIIHGDIKPHNVIIKPDNTPVIIDYDMCKICIHDKFDVNNIFGTKFFMPPEMTTKQIISTKIDIWSLGVTLYSCIIKNPIPKNISNGDFPEIYDYIYNSIEHNKNCIISTYGNFILQLINTMLIKNESKRPSASELCNIIQNTIHNTSKN